MIRTKAGVCYEPKILYKPQFAYPAPQGFRAESFVLPFTFQVPADGKLYQNMPWRLDDDVPFVLRGIVFPQIGTAQQNAGTGTYIFTPGQVRIRDTYGNPMSLGLVLSFGPQGQSGFATGDTAAQQISGGASGINAWGFPFDCEVYCEPGGAILFDFQLATNAGVATAGTAGITFTAAVFGSAGSSAFVSIVNPGTANHALTIGVAGSTVTVTLATNGASAITSTQGQVAALINSTPAAAAIMSAVTPTPATTATADSTALFGGTASTIIPVQGTLLGAKLYKDC